MKRVKRRYMLLKIEMDAALNERDFMDTVWASITKLYGEVGASQTGLCFIDFEIERKIAVIRVSLVAQELVRASLATVTRVSGKEASVYVQSVSGTLKALLNKS